MNRKYNVIWKRDDKGTQGRHNLAPMTHREACVFLPKLTKYPWRRDLLQEI